MIITVKILEVLAKFKSIIRGPALWCRGEIDDAQIAVVIYAKEFPVGLIGNFIVGEELGCYFKTAEGKVKAEALPLENQSPKVLSRLFGLLMNMANEGGQLALNELPDVTPQQINGPLPPEPQPEAMDLERLFQLSVEDPTTSQEEEDPF